MKSSIGKEIVSSLIQQIVHGNIKTGTVLPSIEHLADHYQVSRTVMREVYFSLSVKGLVRSVPRLGTVIQPDTNWDWWDKEILITALQNKEDKRKLEELIEYLYLLEPAVSELATFNADKEDIHYINQCLENLKKSTNSIENWAEADAKFHESILYATHNQLMINLGKEIAGAITLSRLKNKNASFLEHLDFNYEEQLIKAIEQKQGQLARHLMHLILIKKK